MSNFPTSFEELTAWQKADYLDLELHLRTTMPLQRLEWLEQAFAETLQMALELGQWGRASMRWQA